MEQCGPCCNLSLALNALDQSNEKEVGRVPTWDEKRLEMARLVWVYCLPKDPEKIVLEVRQMLLDALDLAEQSGTPETIINNAYQVVELSLKKDV